VQGVRREIGRPVDAMLSTCGGGTLISDGCEVDRVTFEGCVKLPELMRYADEMCDTGLPTLRSTYSASMRPFTSVGDELCALKDLTRSRY
jgi:hypothetical protein